jgi:hypothetical protein
MAFLPRCTFSRTDAKAKRAQNARSQCTLRPRHIIMHTGQQTVKQRRVCLCAARTLSINNKGESVSIYSSAAAAGTLNREQSSLVVVYWSMCVFSICLAGQHFYCRVTVVCSNVFLQLIQPPLINKFRASPPQQEGHDVFGAVPSYLIGSSCFIPLA